MRVKRKTLCVSFSIVFELKTALKEVKNLKKRRRKLKRKSIGLSLAVPGCFKEMQVRNKEVSTIEVSPDPLPIPWSTDTEVQNWSQSSVLFFTSAPSAFTS